MCEGHSPPFIGVRRLQWWPRAVSASNLSDVDDESRRIRGASNVRSRTRIGTQRSSRMVVHNDARTSPAAQDYFHARYTGTRFVSRFRRARNRRSESPANSGQIQQKLEK